MLDHDRPGVSRSLVEAVGGAPAGGWDVTPLRGSEQPRGFLAIMRPSRPSPVVARDPLRAASQRWHLTARQTQVLHWIAHGLTNVLIAETLGITEGTVEFHVKSLFDKAGVESRAMLIVKMLEG